VAVSPTQAIPKYWPSARYFTEAIQCPAVCFAHPQLRDTLPAVDRLGMPLVTSGQFAYVYKLNSTNGGGDFAVRCFRGYLGDRDQRYRVMQEHLRAAPAPYLSDFTYASEGILVLGKRFPILFMQWIDGPTLDLYLGEMLERRDVLLHLSEEWLRLVSGLKASGVAHGDLQHGNIIVEHGRLRLVDHDGIFAPKMAGWSASEVGHQHYQHPRRNANHFDAELDNFSSLVIYLSLLSLAERPDLWADHHDENLIFTKADFADPSSSSLFRKIREIGPEHHRLAGVLAEAATRQATDIPCVLELVKSRSALPPWMTAPVGLEGTNRTREVVPVEPAVAREPVRWTPWGEKIKTPAVPTTVPTSFQTLFGSAPPVQIVRDPQDILGNTREFANEFLRKYFIWWYWGIYLVIWYSGLGMLPSLTFALVFLGMACLSFGFVYAVVESRKAKKPNLSVRQHSAAALPPVSQTGLSASSRPAVNLPPPSVSASHSFIGNLVLGIYHAEHCSWVGRISTKNRVTFSTTADAQSHGFKPCRICSPAG
jgi:hypothetical protein